MPFLSALPMLLEHCKCPPRGTNLFSFPHPSVLHIAVSLLKQTNRCVDMKCKALWPCFRRKGHLEQSGWEYADRDTVKKVQWRREGGEGSVWRTDEVEEGSGHWDPSRLSWDWKLCQGRVREARESGESDNSLLLTQSAQESLFWYWSFF